MQAVIISMLSLRAHHVSKEGAGESVGGGVEGGEIVFMLFINDPNALPKLHKVQC